MEEEKVDGAPTPVAEETEVKNVPWVKATPEEKLDRCRFYIKDMMEVLGNMQKSLNKLEANFFNHKHMDDIIVSQMSQFGDMLRGGDKPVDNRPEEEKWF